MSGEKASKNLDLRHRLNSEGKRYGRVIAYKYVRDDGTLPSHHTHHIALSLSLQTHNRDSEIRYLELLEDLCETLPRALPLQIDESVGPSWTKLDSPSKKTKAKEDFGKDLYREHKRSLGNYCAKIVDEHEDDIIALLKEDLSSDEGTGDSFNPHFLTLIFSPLISEIE